MQEIKVRMYPSDVPELVCRKIIYTERNLVGGVSSDTPWKAKGFYGKMNPPTK